MRLRRRWWRRWDERGLGVKSDAIGCLQRRKELAPLRGLELLRNLGGMCGVRVPVAAFAAARRHLPPATYCQGFALKRARGA